MRVGDKIAPLHHPILKPANLPDFLAVARIDRLQSARTFCSASASPAFFSVFMTADNFISPEGKFALCQCS
jgi:hypothetical protein